MIVLSNEQKNKIANVVGQKGEYTFFQSQSFSASDKVRGMDDNAALLGDVAHFLAHGITFGGMLHSLGRSARWTEVSNNAYNKAISNHLKAYRAADTQVIVIGKKYITLYQEGESSSKQIFFENLVKIEYVNHAVVLVEKRADGKYYRARLLDVGEQMADMIQTILFYRVNAQGLGVGVPIEFEQMGYRNSEYRKNTQRR